MPVRVYEGVPRLKRNVTREQLMAVPVGEVIPLDYIEDTYEGKVYEAFRFFGSGTMFPAEAPRDAQQLVRFLKTPDGWLRLSSDQTQIPGEELG